MSKILKLLTLSTLFGANLASASEPESMFDFVDDAVSGYGVSIQIMGQRKFVMLKKLPSDASANRLRKDLAEKLGIDVEKVLRLIYMGEVMAFNDVPLDIGKIGKGGPIIAVIRKD